VISFIDSRIYRRALTREFRGECGAEEVLQGEGMTSRRRGTPASQGPCWECVTNFSKIIFITLSLYNFYYFVSFIVPFIVLYMEHAATSWYPQVFKNVGRQHDIRFKIKIAIFAERYPFLSPQFFLLCLFILNMSKLKKGRSWYFQVFGICFTERYPFYRHRVTNVKIVFQADFENDDWKAGSIAVARWTSMRLSL